MSNKSESIKNLAGALAAAQAEMPAAELNATNPFLKSKFADLSSVISTARPILAQHGLSVSQLPSSSEGQLVGVTTILMHTSGEWIEATIALPLGSEKGKSMAQVAGSIITYLRRYSLSAILNMYAEEDTDGNAPKQGEGKPAPRRRAPAPKAKKAQSPSKQGQEAQVPRNMAELYQMAEERDISKSSAVDILTVALAEEDKTIKQAIDEKMPVADLWNKLITYAP